MKCCKLCDAIEVNPKEVLRKGTMAKKIAMESLQPFQRDINRYEITPFNGGSKFRNDDTIMARITPCLENGKIAKVNVLEPGEIGFGSTEFIVFRAKEGVTDPDYVYYLVRSPLVRDPAIKSMVGSSGRQRVQTNVIENLILSFPSFEEQYKIGKTLKALDDKIELNNQINENLQQQAQAIYQHMFGITKNRPTNGVLSDICSLSTEKVDVSKLDLENYYSTENMLSNKGGAVTATALPSVAQTTRCQPGDTLVSNIRPYFKKILYCTKDGGCSTDVLCFRPKEPEFAAFLHNTLYNDRFFDYMMAGAKGTKMPRGDKQQIMEYPIYLSCKNDIRFYGDITTTILEETVVNLSEIKTLNSIRDESLSKLLLCNDNILYANGGRKHA